MVVLFLIALLLAWPTAGLSIIAYVAFAVFRSYVDAKARIHHGNERRASRGVASGERRVPSWADNEDECEIFVEVIQKMAQKRGVPQTFLWAILGDKSTFRNIIFLAGEMEREGASFIEQQMAAAGKLEEIWNDAPENVRAASLS